ncbi:MAG: CDP-alcohol phosphatidyltransferase family protein, partial [Rhizorhabdus sp.]
MNSSSLSVRPIGTNPTPIWGMTSTERLRRIAAAEKLTFRADQGGGPTLLVAASHVFEPAWLRFMAARPGTVLTLGGETVIAHVA